MKRDMNTLSLILKTNSLFYVHCTVFSRIFQQDVLTGRTDESQVPSDEELVLLSKKSAICDKLVNASNLKLLHGLSLKTAKLKLSKLFQFYFQDLTVFFILLQFTFAFVAYGR